MKIFIKLLLSLALVVWVASVNPQGTYQLSFVNSNVSIPANITFKITDRYISIRGGCNTQTGYAAFNNDGSGKFGPFLSTAQQNVCQNNTDSVLLNGLQSTTSYKIQSDKTISLFDSKSSLLLNLTLLQANNATVSVSGILATLDAIKNGNITIPSSNTSQANTSQTNTSKTNTSQTNTSQTSTSQTNTYQNNTSQTNTSQTNQTNTYSSNQASNNQPQSLSNGTQSSSSGIIIIQNSNNANNNNQSKVPISNSSSNAVIILPSNTSSLNSTTNSSSSLLSNNTIVISNYSGINTNYLNNSSSSNSSSTSNTSSISNNSSNYQFMNTSNTSTSITNTTNSIKNITQSQSNQTKYSISNTSSIINNSASNNTSVVITSTKISTNLDGLFSTSLNANPNALIRINGTTISLENGCNSAQASINAYSDRSLIIENFSSTKKLCINDTDSVYLTALSKSVKFNSFVNNSLIILSDSTGKLTITLSLYTPSPVIQSPRFSFTNGKYTTNIPNDTKVLIQFLNGSVNILNACNSLKSSYVAFQNGTVKFSQFGGTQMACTNSFDYLFENAIQNSVLFQINGKSINLIDNQNKSTIVLSPYVAPVVPVVPVVPIVPPPTSITLDGLYVTNIPNNPKIQVNITGSKLYIMNGCNSQSTTYKADSNGAFSANLFISTRMACSNDYDYLYVNAFTNSTSYQKNGNQIVLSDSTNKTSIILTPYVAPSIPVSNATQVVITPPAKISSSLDGLFSTSLNANPNALVKINGSTISLINGCNSAQAPINAYTDGSLIIGNFAITRKYCSNDTDSVYLTALSKSIKYNSFVNNSLIIFSDASGTLTITLTLYTPPPVVESPRFSFTNGKYTTNISNDTKVLIQFLNGSVNILNACNSLKSTYVAFQNGTVKFSQFGGTQMACTNSFDYLFENAIQNSVLFQINGKSINLIDNQNKSTIVLSPYVAPVVPVVPIVPPPTPITLDGLYVTNIPNNPKIQVNITGSKLFIMNGCNSQSTTYKADSSGAFSANLFISTRMACSNDYDYLYVNAFTNSTNYQKNGNQIVLSDSTNKTSIILTPYVAPPIPVVPSATSILFNGNFTTNIQNNPNILVSFNNNQIILLNGCNSQTSNYFAFSNNTFKIGGFASSVKYCSSDFDYLYTYQFSRSVVFIQSDSNHIQFFDKNNQSTIKLTKFIQPVIVTPPVVITPLVVVTPSVEPVPIIQNASLYYNITPTFKIYAGYYIVTSSDPYLTQIMTNLQNNYYVFLNKNTILAAVRTYLNNYLYYQILIKSYFGTFNAILQYHQNNTEQKRIVLRSLAIIQLIGMEIDYSNCQTQDLINRNCKICNDGYTNLKGWCYKIDKNCSSYLANQCFSCKSGCKLNQGACVV